MRPALCALLAALPVLGLTQETRPAEEKPAPAPEVGRDAPSFRLNDARGEAVSIGGKRERWTVLAFFPKAMTPG